MKIVLFSSNSNQFNGETYLIKNIPSFLDQWTAFCKEHKDDDFVTFSKSPALFMPENTRILNDDTLLAARQIIDEKPDLVIALSFWVTIFDWLSIKDGLIAKELKQQGINVICPQIKTSLICFDKYQTHNFLVQNNFPKAKAFFVDHELYFCGGNRKEIKYNVYKEAVHSLIKEMNFPLIIKDPVSLSSYAMDVLHTKGEVINYLNSKKNCSSRLIEEFIQGENYGVELYSYKEKNGNLNVNIFPLFAFSTNKYGITSPKQSLKCGPVFPEDDLQKKLEELLTRLAKLLELEGCCQVDLLLHDKEWYIIEINPRLSGMTQTYCASLKKSLYQILYIRFILKQNFYKTDFSPCLNIKLEILENEKLNQLKKLPGIVFIKQIHNTQAKQEREKGFCEVILNGKTKKELKFNLNTLYTQFREAMEENFYTTANQMIEDLL